MEDVLAVYTRPRDPDRPLVCLDETSKQLLAETRATIPMKPGRPARYDYEYERNGTANLFMLFAPLEGWRRVKVTDRHTAVDYAHVLKDVADIHFSAAQTIVLVQDNLNIHSKASLYEAFPAAEARRLVERFEWHYTPKHGSWLNLAESELGVLSSQCLDRRIPDKQTLVEEVAAWEKDRNTNHAKANWQFTTPDARIELKHLYPSILLNRPTSDTRRSLASSTAARNDHARVASFFCSLSGANAPPKDWRIDGPSIDKLVLTIQLADTTVFSMTEAAPINAVMRALADPTRRAVFEQVVSSDEITVVELTRGSGVTQGAISQHLKALKQAGLVAERPEGRKVYYRAQPEGLEPLVDWMSHYGVFWRERFANLRTLLKEIDP